MYGKILVQSSLKRRPLASPSSSWSTSKGSKQHPLILRFWFYKPHDRWYLSTVFFNDQLQGVPGT